MYPLSVGSCSYIDCMIYLHIEVTDLQIVATERSIQSLVERSWVEIQFDVGSYSCSIDMMMYSHIEVTDQQIVGTESVMNQSYLILKKFEIVVR